MLFAIFWLTIEGANYPSALFLFRRITTRLAMTGGEKAITPRAKGQHCVIARSEATKQSNRRICKNNKGDYQSPENVWGVFEKEY